MNDEQVVEVIVEFLADSTSQPEAEAGLLLDALRAAGFDVYRVEDRQRWKFCPVCGRHNRPEDGGLSGVVYCSPTNCSAWKIRATFDHEAREWVPVGGDS